MGRKKGGTNKTHVCYTVYRRKTDFPMIIGGTAEVCSCHEDYSWQFPHFLHETEERTQSGRLEVGDLPG